jgi:serine carboxypeptidase-like clade 2
MKIFRELLALCVAAMAAAGAQAGQNDAALVTGLPNLEQDVPFKQYAGQIPLATEEKLFYWYTEAQESPAEAPIVLWLNGGPGCSSMGGFWTENGPFVVGDDLSVKVNRYAWNRKVNLVWLESPAGVGFSGELQDASYYNDDNVAAKTYEFLQLFFDKFPELKGREFYITGESYAGIYIPYLVDLLVDTPIPDVDLKGFAIGNPFTDDKVDGNAYLDFYYSHAMVSLENYNAARELCGGNIGCFFMDDGTCQPECLEVLAESNAAADADRLNPYYIYGDVCFLGNGQALTLHKTLTADKQPKATSNKRGDVGVCAETLTQFYLNLPEVQRAIHVEGANVNWTDCNDAVSDSFTRSSSSLPKYHNILGRGLNALIYSGDADSVVNFIGTERWIGPEGLKLHVTDKWKAWFGPDRQVAGYVQQYDGLTFKTVKGAGHMVPAVRPLHGLNMFECFIFGEDNCASFVYPIDEEEVEAGLVSFSDLRKRATVNAATASDVPAGLLWFPALAVLAVAGGLVLVRIRNGKKRAEYERINSPRAINVSV